VKVKYICSARGVRELLHASGAMAQKVIYYNGVDLVSARGDGRLYVSISNNNIGVWSGFPYTSLFLVTVAASDDVVPHNATDRSRVVDTSTPLLWCGSTGRFLFVEKYFGQNRFGRIIV